MRSLVAVPAQCYAVRQIEAKFWVFGVWLDVMSFKSINAAALNAALISTPNRPRPCDMAGPVFRDTALPRPVLFASDGSTRLTPLRCCGVFNPLWRFNNQFVLCGNFILGRLLYGLAPSAVSRLLDTTRQLGAVPKNESTGLSGNNAPLDVRTSGNRSRLAASAFAYAAPRNRSLVSLGFRDLAAYLWGALCSAQVVAVNVADWLADHVAVALAAARSDWSLFATPASTNAGRVWCGSGSVRPAMSGDELWRTICMVRLRNDLQAASALTNHTSFYHARAIA